LHILQICHSYYPPFLDCARQYAALFHGTEHHVTTVYLTGDEDEEVARLTCSDTVIFLGYNSRQVRGLKLGAIAKIKKLAEQNTFDFCIAHRVKPTYVALLATKLPVISVHHNYNDYTRYSRRWFINLFKSRLLMLGVSDSVRDDLRRDLKGWPSKRIQTLYNHIDVEATQSGLLTRSAARAYLGLAESSWIVGNVGRLHHDKDQVTLIHGFHQALSKLPSDSLLMIMGTGPLESRLKQLVDSLNIRDRVIFAGQVVDARKYFKAFDVFALTSNHEPFGMVLLEAMAADVPLICSDCGGGAEVVRDVGSLFPYQDVNALAMSLINSALLQHNPMTPTKKLKEVFSDEAARLKFWEIVNDSNLLIKSN